MLTEFTSFVAVDETPRDVAKLDQTVQQPLPLAQGLEESAVGGSGAPAHGQVAASGAIAEA
ncbi:MAG: hypothetical protein R3F11_31945 [Verrucomicrobiales bacterium]